MTSWLECHNIIYDIIKTWSELHVSGLCQSSNSSYVEVSNESEAEPQADLQADCVRFSSFANGTRVWLKPGWLRGALPVLFTIQEFRVSNIWYSLWLDQEGHYDFQPVSISGWLGLSDWDCQWIGNLISCLLSKNTYITVDTGDQLADMFIQPVAYQQLESAL